MSNQIHYPVFAYAGAFGDAVSGGMLFVVGFLSLTGLACLLVTGLCLLGGKFKWKLCLVGLVLFFAVGYAPAVKVFQKYFPVLGFLT